MTRGGEISGNWETGRETIDKMPRNTTIIDSMIARTGRWMNLLAKLIGLPLQQTS
jgi:hypothetical protein